MRDGDGWRRHLTLWWERAIQGDTGSTVLWCLLVPYAAESGGERVHVIVWCVAVVGPMVGCGTDGPCTGRRGFCQPPRVCQ